jgi:hypothetical protein
VRSLSESSIRNAFLSMLIAALERLRDPWWSRPRATIETGQPRYPAGRSTRYAILDSRRWLVSVGTALGCSS